MTNRQNRTKLSLVHLVFGASFIVCIAIATKSPATQTPWIYFADNNAQTVNRMAFDGTDFQVLANTTEALLGLTIDRVDQKIYWSDNPQNGKARLHRADFNGANASVFYEATIPNQGETVGQLAIDEAARKIYWIDSGADRLRKMNLDGTGLVDILTNEPRMETALELNSSGNQLYFSTGSMFSNPLIERINVDGSGRQVIGSAYAYSIYLDESQNRILGADWNASQIFQLASPAYSRSTLFAAGAPRDIQRFQDFLIYSDSSDFSQAGVQGYWSRIMRSNLDGSNAVILREINRLNQPADPIALYILVPEPSTLIYLVIGLIASASQVRRRH